MKRYTFGTFLVDDANREAFEVCRDIAYLRPAGTRPVSLVGEHGFGKTHLLYSIVNRVRGGSRDIGIAYVRGTDFPRSVRDLVPNPEPIKRVRTAILLVDDLDAFEEGQDDLEAVVRLFLDHNHYVVFASRTAPAELMNLTPGLLEILKRGRSIKILANRLGGTGESVYDKMEEPDAVIARQRERIAELESRVTAPESTQSLFGPEFSIELDSLRAELARTRSELDRTEDEIEHLRAENALLNVSTRELKPLRERLKELEDSQAAYEPAAIPSGAEKAREEANRVLAEADELISEVDQPAGNSADREEDRAEIERLQEELEAARERDADIREMLAEANGEIDRLKAAVAEAQLERNELTNAIPAADAHTGQLEQELSAARAECDRLRGAIVRARAERETVKAQVRRTLEELTRKTAELDYVRKQAAEDKEKAHLEIAELEERLARSRNAQAEPAAADDMEDAHEEAAAPDMTGLASDEPDEPAAAPPADSAPTNIAELRARLTEALEEDENPATVTTDDVCDREPQDDADPADNAATVENESVARPDFGDPARRPAPRLSATLHHVEEIRADLNALGGLSNPDADSDHGTPQQREQSA